MGATEANGRKDDRVFQLVAPKRATWKLKQGGQQHGHDAASGEQGDRQVEEVRATTEELFAQLGLRDWLCANAASLGMRSPTKVQTATISHALAGKDILGCSGTGSGKTAAFALPVLHRIGDRPTSLACVVLTPARELALQVASQFRALGAGMNLDCAEITGGADFQKQAIRLKRLPHVIVATPGRMHEHLRSHESLSPALQDTRFFVMDEADRLLSESFEQELRDTVACMHPSRQTMLFSATMTDSIAQLRSMTLRKAAQYIESDHGGMRNQLPPRLLQLYSLVPSTVKEAYVAHIARNLSSFDASACLVFARTCKSVQIVAETLTELGVSAVPLHSVLLQKHRHASLQRFKAGAVSTLVATDVAARGLDLPDVGMVVNHDVPKQPKDYVHRVGRTARNGKRGTAITLVSQKEVDLIKAVESEIGTQLTDANIKEDDALKSLGTVFAARRTACMRTSEPDGFQARLDVHKQRKRKRQEYQQQQQGVQ